MGASPETRDTTILRGAEAKPISPRFWLVAGTLLCTTLVVLVIVSFISAINDNSRIERLKSHGVPVTVYVTNCEGNIGGSGSNAAGYTCHGKYSVNGMKYQEVIGSKTTFSAPGTTVHAVADPDRPSTIELTSAVRSSSVSSSVYVVPSILALVLATLAFILLRRRAD